MSLSCASGQGFWRFCGFTRVFGFFLRFLRIFFGVSWGLGGSSDGFFGFFLRFLRIFFGGSWGLGVVLPMVFPVFPTVSLDLFGWSWGLWGGVLGSWGVFRWFFSGLCEGFSCRRCPCTGPNRSHFITALYRAVHEVSVCVSRCVHVRVGVRVRNEHQVAEVACKRFLCFCPPLSTAKTSIRDIFAMIRRLYSNIAGSFPRFDTETLLTPSANTATLLAGDLAFEVAAHIGLH